MSLLIKALQKAEQRKEAAGAEKAGEDVPPLELAPHHGEPESELSLAEESGFHDPRHPAATASAAGPAAKSSTVPERNPEREAAANVFRAREAADPGARRAFWLGISGLALLLLLGIGFYFYLDTLQQPEVVAARPISRPQPIAPAPAPATQPSAPLEQQTAAVAALVTPEPPSAPTAPEAVAGAAEPPAAKPVPPAEPVLEKPLVTTATPGARKTPPQPVTTAGNGDNPAIEIKRGRKSEPAVDATSLAAYQAFMAGDDAAAGRLYRQLLQADPRSIDALLGLAAVAARQGKSDEAAGYYGRVLELEPRNSVAQAGLTALAGNSDPVTAQSRVKSLLARQPDDAYLHAVLGGLYAEQNQWGSAQQAYFQAFRLDPGNAEHAFNLAVSLDQLGKADLALDYYQRALELLPAQGGSVDRAALERRVAQLRSTLGK